MSPSGWLRVLSPARRRHIGGVAARWARDPWTWVGVAALTFLVLFLLWPTLRLLAASLMDTSAYGLFFRKAYYYRSLTNSLWLSGAATLLSVLVGVPLAWLTARTDIPLKGLVRTLAVLSVLSPPFIGAYAWVLLLGRSGFVTKLLGLDGFSIYGPGGVLLVFVLHHFAFVYLLAEAALQRIDPALEEAAETLGSPPLRRLFTVTLPLALPGIAAGALLVFTTTLGDFGTPMLIGEGLRTLPVVAYGEFLSELGGNPGMASAASAIMLALALGALGLQAWALGGRNYAMQGLRRPVPLRLAPGARAAGAMAALIAVGLAALPQLVVLVTSVLETRGPLFTGRFSLEQYRVLLSRMSGPVGNTLLYAGLAAIIMLVGGMLASYLLVRRPGLRSRLLDGLLILAQVLPGTVLGISLLVAWGRPPLAITGTGAVLVIAYIIRRIAYTVRASAAGLRQVHPAVEEASLTLGAGPLTTFRRITAPLILPAALSGAVVSWVSTLSELSATIMLYGPRTATVSIHIYNQVLTDSFGTAAALGAVLILLTLLSLWLLERLGGGVRLES